jgi:hypothetical protein
MMVGEVEASTTTPPEPVEPGTEARTGSQAEHSPDAHDPLDERDDIYDALSVREGPWFMRGEGEELLPVSREQIARALAWGRWLTERDNPPATTN